MGASQYKKQRMEERANGPTQKELAQQEAASKKKKQRILYSVIGVIVVLLIAAVIFINSAFFSTGLSAVKVGDVSFNVAETRFAYNTLYNEVYSTYGSYGLIDTSTPLDEQPCLMDPELTWKEYLMEQAVNYLQQISTLYSAAKAEGRTISEDGQLSIDNSISTMEMYATLSGYNLDSYIALTYGEGNNEESFRHMMEVSQLAYEYSAEKQASFSYTDEELDSYYAENAESYNKVSYLSAYISGAADEANGVDAETAMANALAAAEAIEAACDGTPESFSAAVLAETGSEPSELSTTLANLGDNYDWFTAAERTAGDVHVVENESSVQLYCYLAAENNQYNTVNVRHILVMANDADGDGVYSDEEKDAALSTLKEIETEWDGTEEHFAELANTYSNDTGSNTVGGLYENIYKGQMVEEFNDFCFSGAAPGDTAIVYGETTGYAGYHLVYFVGEGQLYADYLADSALRNNDYVAWEDDMLAQSEVEKTFMFRYV